MRCGYRWGWSGRCRVTGLRHHECDLDVDHAGEHECACLRRKARPGQTKRP
jgi:hypothetical protein